jgi:uncharacterized membrane-anchored protein
MGTRYKWLAFGGMVLFQLALPGWVLVDHERVLTEGEVFLFSTEPIDPRDPFRGEYVTLNFDAESGQWASPTASTEGEYVRSSAFAVLGTDTGGFARIERLTHERPSGSAFVEVQFMSFGSDGVSRVSLPFDRFYLEEGDGAATEQMLLPQWSNDSLVQPLPSHAVVRILNGRAVIEDLVVGGRSIHEWLKDMPASE